MAESSTEQSENLDDIVELIERDMKAGNNLFAPISESDDVDTKLAKANSEIDFLTSCLDKWGNERVELGKLKEEHQSLKVRFQMLELTYFEQLRSSADSSRKIANLTLIKDRITQAFEAAKIESAKKEEFLMKECEKKALKCQAVCQDLANKLAIRVEKCEKLEEENGELKRKVESLNSALDEQIGENSELKQNFRNSKKDVESINSSLEEKVRENDELQKANEESKGLCERLREQIQNLEKTNEEIQGQFETLTNQNQELESQYKNLKTELEKLNDEIENTKSKLEKSKSAAEEMRDLKESIRRQLLVKSKQYDEKCQEVEASEKKYEILKVEFEEFKSQFSNIDSLWSGSPESPKRSQKRSSGIVKAPRKNGYSMTDEGDFTNFSQQSAKSRRSESTEIVSNRLSDETEIIPRFIISSQTSPPVERLEQSYEELEESFTKSFSDDIIGDVGNDQENENTEMDRNSIVEEYDVESDDNSDVQNVVVDLSQEIDTEPDDEVILIEN